MSSSATIRSYQRLRKAGRVLHGREKEPGFRKKRFDMPEDYSLYFHRLHRRSGIGVTYGPEA